MHALKTMIRLGKVDMAAGESRALYTDK